MGGCFRTWSVFMLNVGMTETYHLFLSDLTHLDIETGEALLHWIYNDELKVPNKQLDFLICLLKAASQYQLCDLICCCEQLLIPMVNITNCVKLFVGAEEYDAQNLRNFCASLMSSHWVSFQPCTIFYIFCLHNFKGEIV